MELLELFQGVYHIDNPAVLRRLRDTVQVCRLKKGEVYLHEGERQSRVSCCGAASCAAIIPM